VWSNAWTSITSSPADILLALLILIVTIAIVVFVIWLAVVSQVGLIRNISLNNKNKQTTINDGIDEGVNKFWPILIVNVVYKLILLVIFVLLGKEILLLAKIGSAGVILHIISLLIFSIVVIVISFLVRYQIIFMVIKGEKTVDALKSSYNLFKENWLVSIEMAFILFVVYVIAAYLTAILTSIFLAVPLVFVTYSNQIPVFVIITIGLLSISAVFVITFLITAVLSTFQWASWTLLFDQINSNKTVAKIARLSERSPNVRIPFKK
jgi:hypothetical protein